MTFIKGQTVYAGEQVSVQQKYSVESTDMLVLRGINVFPSQIEHILMSIAEVSTHSQIVVQRIKYFDELMEVVNSNRVLYK